MYVFMYGCYSIYLSCIINIPWHVLKFLDESHFDHRDMYQRRGWSRKGRRINGIKPAAPGIQSCSITIMTSLVEAGGFVTTQPRLGSNTAGDFVLFVLQMIENGYLVAGDYLILDNAAIHVKGGILLHDTLVDYGINMRFLPRYSPELNPCELIFSQIKHYIRYNRRPVPIIDDIMYAMAHVKRDNVAGYYGHCIDHILFD